MKSLLKKISVFVIVVLSICVIYSTGTYINYSSTHDITNKSIGEYFLNVNIDIVLGHILLGAIFWICIIMSLMIILGIYQTYTRKKSKTEKRFDITKHGDFRKYYDTTQKRNYWVLGYFGGGSLNVIDAYEAAKQFSESVGIPIDSVQIDEIFKSRRFKGFKYLYSKAENQEPDKNSDIMKDVWSWLGD